MENRLLNLLGELFISEDNAKMKKEALNDHYDEDIRKLAEEHHLPV